MPRTPSLVRRLGALSVLALGTGGCLPDVGVDVSTRFDTALDHPRTIIERALSECPTRTEQAATRCVRNALGSGEIRPGALRKVLPGCVEGRECHLDYTTEDRIGFVAATASIYRAHWHVTIDLTKHHDTLADVPVAVALVP